MGKPSLIILERMQERASRHTVPTPTVAGKTLRVSDGKIAVNLSTGDRVYVPVKNLVTNTTTSTVFVSRPTLGQPYLFSEIR